MSVIIYRFLPVARILHLVSNTNEFEQWYKQNHGQTPPKNLLHGYKYFVEGCIHLLFDILGGETFAGIQNDFLLNRALNEWVSFEKLENSCEKTILLKNIYRYVIPIKRSGSLHELQHKIEDFENKAIRPVNELLSKHLALKQTATLTYDEMLNISTAAMLYLYFTQIGNSSPVAHFSFLTGVISNTQKKTAAAFEGYKYALQFVWNKVLDKEQYFRSTLDQLHKADSWKNYIYDDPPSGEIEVFDPFGKTYELSVQTCLDSYCERIKQEIILPFENKYKIDILTLDCCWNFRSEKGRKYIKKLLNPKLVPNASTELSAKDKIQTILYWLPLQVVDYANSSPFNGVSAFNTMLAGTVTLFKKSSQFKKCIVCKFVHPWDTDRNHYSYGILIDSKSAANHYNSGWIIYYNCCNDYSGFSNAEHKTTENLIRQYQKEKKVELRELQIGHDEFTAFITDYIYKKREPTGESHNDIVNNLKEISIRNQYLWNDAKAMIVEWVAYYAHSKKYPKHSISWNIEKKNGEIDVFMETPQSIKLVECKVNPNNCDLMAEIGKLREKAIRKEKEYQKPFDLEFWFWFSPSEQNQKILLQNEVGWIELAGQKSAGIFLNIDLSRIKSIMHIDFSP